MGGNGHRFKGGASTVTQTRLLVFSGDPETKEAFLGLLWDFGFGILHMSHSVTRVGIGLGPCCVWKILSTQSQLRDP